MDLRQLRHFVAVLEHGNMLRAAETINVTQPALSKSIRNLEDQLGVKLLERSPRGVSPTRYGLQLLDRAKLILNQTRKAELEIRDLMEGIRGHLNIGFGANFAGLMLPHAILKVVAERPGVTANIVSRPFDELLPMLRQGELDLTVVVFPPEYPDDEFIYEPLIVSEFKVVCRPQHPLAGSKRRIPLSRLAGLDWAVFDRPRATATLFVTAFLNRDVTPPNPVIQTSSVFFLKAALREGDYLSFVPPSLVHDELESGALVILNTEMPLIRFKAGIVYRANDILPAAAMSVVEELRHLREQIGGSDSPGARFARAAGAKTIAAATNKN